LKYNRGGLVMAVTESFKRAVRDNDVESVRIMMKDSLLRDPTCRKFREMENSAKGMDGLYVEDDEYEPARDGDWDENYMIGLMVEVVDNFSKARLEHLKKVVRKLRPQRTSPIGSETQTQRQGSDQQSGKTQASSPNNNAGRTRARNSATSWEDKISELRECLKEAKNSASVEVGIRCIEVGLYLIKHGKKNINI
jgi:hypothetical protein